MRQFFLVLISFVVLVGCSNEDVSEQQRYLETVLQSGDIIFQSTSSRQCKAVKMATNSEYSHVGIVFKIDGEFIVYEALQPVKKTPLREWIKHGTGGHYAVTRLINSDHLLTKSVLKDMKNTADSYLGKDYDIYFEWSDEDFDLSDPLVKSIMSERYGHNVPYQESVIAPEDLFRADNVKLVVKN